MHNVLYNIYFILYHTTIYYTTKHNYYILCKIIIYNIHLLHLFCYEYIYTNLHKTPEYGWVKTLIKQSTQKPSKN